MKIGDFKRFDNEVSVLCGYCNYFDVNMIDIDEDRIELSDNNGFVIGTIDTEQLENCEIIVYDDDGKISDNNPIDLTDVVC